MSIFVVGISYDDMARKSKAPGSLSREDLYTHNVFSNILARETSNAALVTVTMLDEWCM